MKIKLIDLPSEVIIRLKSANLNAQQNKSYLAIPYPEIPYPNIFSILALILLCVFLIFANLWDHRWILIIGGVVTLFFLSRELQKTWFWWMLGKEAVFFDSKYCMAIIKDELTIVSLKEYEFSDIIYSSEGNQYLARFHFHNESIILPYPSREDETYNYFQNLIAQVSNSAKGSNKTENLKDFFPNSFRDRISNRKAPIIVSAFTFILLYFIVPNIIDYNQYQDAKSKDTATSYRAYLNETNNLVYRENARNDIKTLYDKYISQYLTFSSGKSGAKAFQTVLQYLRDNEFYAIEIVFNPSSELQDINSDGYDIKPVTPSFSKEKNAKRQDEVISTVKSALEKIFPTDIITISKENLVGELPRFEIFYSYKNNPESIYYPTEQKFLPDEKKTWYYGIVIQWNFNISLKTKPQPIYDFKLLSQPAAHFNSETLNSDDVYSNMASSAFNDFQNEFQNRFFNLQ